MYITHKIDKDLYFLNYSGKSWPTGSNIIVVPDQNGLNIVDAGLNDKSSFDGFELCINELGYNVSDIHSIYLSHGHTDHIAGVNLIVKHCTPRVYLSQKSIPEAIYPALQEHYCLPSSVREISPTLQDFDILGNFKDGCGEWSLENIDLIPIEDGDRLELGKHRFMAIHVPGHDIGLMVFYEPSLKLLLSTDLLQSSGPGSALPWYTTAAGGVSKYLESLSRIETLDVAHVLPSHGFMNVSIAEAIASTRKQIQTREARILSSLNNGPKSCDELDKVLFSQFLMEICPWYSSVTEAHLVFLENIGLIAREEKGYVLIE